MVPLIFPIITGLGAIFFSGCASQKKASSGPESAAGKAETPEPVVVEIPPVPENSPTDPYASQPSSQKSEEPMGPAHWRALQLEQKLWSHHCHDGKPGLSPRDFIAFSRTPDFDLLKSLYQQTISDHPEKFSPFESKGFVPAYIFVGPYSLHRGLQEALASSPIELSLSRQVVYARTNLHWGSLLYFGFQDLSSDQTRQIKEHIRTEFTEHDANWTGDLRLEVQAHPLQAGLYSYAFHFDYKLQCPNVP